MFRERLLSEKGRAPETATKSAFRVRGAREDQPVFRARGIRNSTLKDRPPKVRRPVPSESISGIPT
jgi:hypothetical protein